MATTFYTGTFWNGYFTPDSDTSVGVFNIAETVLEFANALESGKAVWMRVTDSGVNNGVYEVEFIAPAYWQNDLVNVSLYRGHRGYLKNGERWSLPASGKVEFAYAADGFDTDEPGDPGDDGGSAPTNTIYGGKVGPFMAVPPGFTTTLLMYDIVFPNGVYWMNENTDALSWMYVEIYFFAEEVDDDGDPVGPVHRYWYTESIGQNTPQRRTLRHTVPAGRYRVTAQRKSPISKALSDQSAVYWTGLKSVLGTDDRTDAGVYGNVTLASVRLRATSGISGAAHQQITVDATRHEGASYRPNAGDTLTLALAGGDLRNPVDAFVDIYTNTNYGGRRPSAELDLEGLDYWRAEWANKYFDAVFDQETTLWEALKTALQMQHAAPTTVGATLSVAVDEAKTAYEVLFDTTAIADLTVSYMFPSADDYDGVEGEYKSQDDNAPLYVRHPADCVNPETLTLVGCKSKTRAQAFVERYWKQGRTRRRLFVLETEAAGHVVQVGAAIGIQHPLLDPGSPTLCVVSSVRVNDEFSTTIEGYVYESSVFE